MECPIIVVPFMNINGMALFPFILVQSERLKHDKAVIDHERIHIRQQAELLILPFYLLYLLNYLVNLIVYRNHDKAYMNIVFEREAYANEVDPAYLQQRKLYNWCGYWKV
jgi:hypothetical protein